jgi:uroporphyrin-3 C-methyltransferase
MSKEASKPDNGKAEQNTSVGIPAVSNASKNEKKPNDVKESTNSTSTDVGKKPTTKNKSTSKPKAERPPFSKTALLGLVIALAASGAAGYEFYLLRLQAKQNASFQQAQNSASTRINGLEQELQATRQAMAGEVAAREKVENEQSALKTVMDSISARLGRTSTAWRLAEVEYLLTVANHRLTLAQDRNTAIAIFVSADERIKAIGDPRLVKIRKEIADELNALRSVSEPDLDGMALNLGSLAENVDKLPLIHKERVDAALDKIGKKAPENWRDIPAAVWKDIKSLVVVRRHQQPTEPLLPPKESWFLYQNLRLKIEQARLALMRQDTPLFRQYLEEASGWIKMFFDEESTAVKNTQNTLSSLTKVELKPAMPDVSGSLRDLRQLLANNNIVLGKKADKQ